MPKLFEMGEVLIALYHVCYPCGQDVIFTSSPGAAKEADNPLGLDASRRSERRRADHRVVVDDVGAIPTGARAEAGDEGRRA